MLILQGPKKSRVHTIAYSVDGSTIAATYGRGTVVWLWDVAQAKVRKRLRFHLTRVPALVFSPNGQLMATVDNWGTVAIWRLADGTRLLPPIAIRGDRFYTTALSFSHDSRWLAGGGDYPHVWDVESGRELGAFAATYKNFFTRTVAMASDRNLLVWGRCGEPFVTARDLDTGQQSPPMPTDSEPTQLAFRPDGKELAVLTHRRVTFFDIDRFKSRLHLTIPTGILWRMSYAPDGRSLVTISTNRTICFWDLTIGEPHRKFDWNLGPIWSVAFAPDGLTVAAGATNGRIIVWDVDE